MIEAFSRRKPDDLEVAVSRMWHTRQSKLAKLGEKRIAGTLSPETRVILIMPIVRLYTLIQAARLNGKSRGE